MLGVCGAEGQWPEAGEWVLPAHHEGEGVTGLSLWWGLENRTGSVQGHRVGRGLLVIQPFLLQSDSV